MPSTTFIDTTVTTNADGTVQIRRRAPKAGEFDHALGQLPATEVRKVKNRLNQRAFRERQQGQIASLQSQLEEANALIRDMRGLSLRFKSLERDNGDLEAHVLALESLVRGFGVDEQVLQRLRGSNNYSSRFSEVDSSTSSASVSSLSPPSSEEYFASMPPAPVPSTEITRAATQLQQLQLMMSTSSNQAKYDNLFASRLSEEQKLYLSLSHDPRIDWLCGIEFRATAAKYVSLGQLDLSDMIDHMMQYAVVYEGEVWDPESWAVGGDFWDKYPFWPGAKERCAELYEWRAKGGLKGRNILSIMASKDQEKQMHDDRLLEITDLEITPALL